MSRRRILILGASGFLGANLVRHFASNAGSGGEDEVIALTGPSDPKSHWRLEGLDRSRIRFESCDVTDRSRFRKQLRDLAPHTVVNCAVYGHLPNQQDLDLMYAVNFTAVRDLCDAVAGIPGFRALIHAGSASEYGYNCVAPSETGHMQPDSEYSVSKIASTAYLQYLGKARDFPVWILRIYLAYGPFQDSNRLLSRLIEGGATGKWPELTDPEISRDFIHVDDIAKAMDAILDRQSKLTPGEVFNLGTGIKTRLGDLVTMVQKAFPGVTEAPKWGTLPKRAGDRNNWYADISKARQELGWEPRVDLETGVARTCEWIRTRS